MDAIESLVNVRNLNVEEGLLENILVYVLMCGSEKIKKKPVDGSTDERMENGKNAKRIYEAECM